MEKLKESEDKRDRETKKLKNKLQELSNKLEEA